MFIIKNKDVYYKIKKIFQKIKNYFLIILKLFSKNFPKTMMVNEDAEVLIEIKSFNFFFASFVKF